MSKKLNDTILTENDLKDLDTVESWVWNNINSGKLAQWLTEGAIKRLLRPYVGKPAHEIESAYISMVS